MYSTHAKCKCYYCAIPLEVFCVLKHGVALTTVEVARLDGSWEVGVTGEVEML